MDAQKVYKENISNSHEAAVNAVYFAGYQDGVDACAQAPQKVPEQQEAQEKPKKKKSDEVQS